MRAFLVKYLNYDLTESWVVAAPDSNAALSCIADSEGYLFEYLHSTLITSVVVTTDITKPTILS